MSDPKQKPGRPQFSNEEEEASWWASAEGRAFLHGQSAARPARADKGSALVSKLSGIRGVQIALRPPASDLAWTRGIAARKGMGYQTLLKMLVREGPQ